MLPMEQDEEKNPKKQSRRKFITQIGLYAGGAVAGGAAIYAGLDLEKEKAPYGERLRLLAADGKLVEVDSAYAKEIEAGKQVSLEEQGRAVAVALEVVVVVAEDAALMAQKLAEGDRVTSALVGKLEVSEVGDHRGVKVERALVYKRHDEGGGVDLSDGADREEGVGAGWVASLEAGDAVGADFALSIAQHTNGDTGDSPAGHLHSDVGVQIGGDEAGFGWHCCPFPQAARE